MTQPATLERVTAAVRGMHCAACVGKVERALRGVPGVEHASVNLATEHAQVAFDPARTSFAALQAAVSSAGYELAASRGGAVLDDGAARRADDQRALVRRGIVRAAPSAGW